MSWSNLQTLTNDKDSKTEPKDAYVPPFTLKGGLSPLTEIEHLT